MDHIKNWRWVPVTLLLLFLALVPVSTAFASHTNDTGYGYQDGKTAAIMAFKAHKPGISLINGDPSCHAGPPCTQLDIAYHNFHQGYLAEWSVLCKCDATAVFLNLNLNQR
jgi:hypothetical protein